jgi:hypothetical protein
VTAQAPLTSDARTAPNRTKTPLEAIQDADGREMVEALITQLERDAERMPVPPSAEVFSALRRRLGL